MALGSLLLLAGCSTTPSPMLHVHRSDHNFEEADASPVPAPRVSRLIRVAILTRQRTLRIVAPENYTLSGFNLGPDRANRSITLTLDQLTSPKARLQGLGNTGVEVNGQFYSGTLEIFPDEGGTLTVVNELDLEDYVAGVVMGEVPKDWPLEALKAQAMASRTFAVMKRAEARAIGKTWDLENHTYYQVYRGSAQAPPSIRKSVLSTRGLVVTWKGKPINALFHSNCGGQTSRAGDVWGGNEPYLQSVVCRFCRNGPHYSWTALLGHGDISRDLRAAGLMVGDLSDLTPLDRDEAGRILKILAQDTDGRRFEIKGSAFRAAIGPDLIRGTRFDVKLTADGFRFKGRGWGHGVGLCQEGACGMAQAGYNAKEILRKYYPGTLVESLDDL